MKNNINENEVFEKIMAYERNLHEKNQKRIQIGIRLLLVIPLIFLAIMFKMESNKVVFLAMWIISLFAIAIYLIGIEYMDHEAQNALKKIGLRDKDEENDGLLDDNMDMERIMKVANALSEGSRISDRNSRLRALPQFEDEEEYEDEDEAEYEIEEEYEDEEEYEVEDEYEDEEEYEAEEEYEDEEEYEVEAEYEDEEEYEDEDEYEDEEEYEDEAEPEIIEEYKGPEYEIPEFDEAFDDEVYDVITKNIPPKQKKKASKPVSSKSKPNSKKKYSEGVEFLAAEIERLDRLDKNDRMKKTEVKKKTSRPVKPVEESYPEKRMTAEEYAKMRKQRAKKHDDKKEN